MELRMLMKGMNVEAPALMVTDITAHSGRSVPGGLFLAYAGDHHHGLEFIDEAVAANVAAVAWEPSPRVAPPQLPDTVVGIAVPDLRDRIGTIANRFFAQPSAALTVTGITGTNGKTTTAWLVAEALNRLGRKGAYMGTLGHGVAPALTPSALTTPGCIAVHRRLRAMVDAGATDAIMEVSSHGLDQGRIDGVRFRTAVLTNLSRDHLDYHGTLEAYGEAKARLFLETGIETAVLNVGDAFARALLGRLPASVRTVTVAVTNESPAALSSDLTAELLGSGPDGLRLALSGRFGQAELKSPLWGRFNVENIVVATGILLAQEFSLAQAVTALAGCIAPPGRMQIVEQVPGQPIVVVDYAHTPDALNKALEAVKEHCRGQLWCVFGCGGNRDQGKRSKMGAVAAAMADRTIVTDDNPRDEDPGAIIREIVAGTGNAAVAEVVPDRGAAIHAAVEQAGADDVVLIAGKGSETVQIIRGQAHEFSDLMVARAALGLAE